MQDLSCVLRLNVILLALLGSTFPGKACNQLPSSPWAPPKSSQVICGPYQATKSNRRIHGSTQCGMRPTHIVKLGTACMQGDDKRAKLSKQVLEALDFEISTPPACHGFTDQVRLVHEPWASCGRISLRFQGARIQRI